MPKRVRPPTPFWPPILALVIPLRVSLAKRSLTPSSRTRAIAQHEKLGRSASRLRLQSHAFFARLALRVPSAAWKPSLTIKHLLIGIQTLLDDPNNLDPAQEEPYKAFKNDRKDYDAKVKAQVTLLRG